MAEPGGGPSDWSQQHHHLRESNFTENMVPT